MLYRFEWTNLEISWRDGFSTEHPKYIEYLLLSRSKISNVPPMKNRGRKLNNHDQNLSSFIQYWAMHPRIRIWFSISFTMEQNLIVVALDATQKHKKNWRHWRSWRSWMSDRWIHKPSRTFACSSQGSQNTYKSKSHIPDRLISILTFHKAFQQSSVNLLRKSVFHLLHSVTLCSTLLHSVTLCYTLSIPIYFHSKYPVWHRMLSSQWHHRFIPLSVSHNLLIAIPENRITDCEKENQLPSNQFLILSFPFLSTWLDLAWLDLTWLVSSCLVSSCLLTVGEFETNPMKITDYEMQRIDKRTIYSAFWNAYSASYLPYKGKGSVRQSEQNCFVHFNETITFGQWWRLFNSGPK
jgi:hypothetical protein